MKLLRQLAASYPWQWGKPNAPFLHSFIFLFPLTSQGHPQPLRPCSVILWILMGFGPFSTPKSPTTPGRCGTGFWAYQQGNAGTASGRDKPCVWWWSSQYRMTISFFSDHPWRILKQRGLGEESWERLQVRKIEIAARASRHSFHREEFDHLVREFTWPTGSWCQTK